jgi:hypothetical protein
MTGCELSCPSYLAHMQIGTVGGPLRINRCDFGMSGYYSAPDRAVPFDGPHRPRQRQTRVRTQGRPDRSDA